MNDLISRAEAIDAPEKFIKDCNPNHFVGHQKFIEYMDNAEIGSFGKWQFANGFNMGLTAAEVAIKKLPSAQPERLTDDDFETIRIHLNAYKEKLCNQRRWEEAKEYQRIIDRFMAFASAQPTAEPVRHGKWIFNPSDAFEAMFAKPKCSECGFESADGGNYCPNCGCRMDEE